MLDLLMSEGLGPRYGAPRRRAQERIRSAGVCVCVCVCVRVCVGGWGGSGSVVEGGVVWCSMV